MKKLIIAFTVVLLTLTVSLSAADKAQAKCPIKGKDISKTSKFVDAEGFRIYVCCNGCVKKIKKDPAKYIAKLKKEGVELEKAPAK